MYKIAKYIDHTVLKATTTTKDVEKLCSEAKEYGLIDEIMANKKK